MSMTAPDGCPSLGRACLLQISSMNSLPRHRRLTIPLIRTTLVEMRSSSIPTASVEAEANPGAKSEPTCMAQVMTLFKFHRTRKRHRLAWQAQHATSENEYHAQLPPLRRSTVPKYRQHASQIRRARDCFPHARQSLKKWTPKSQP